MKKLSSEIINSELKDWYTNNPIKILKILRTGFPTSVKINNKPYEAVIAEDMYHQYAYFLILDKCDLFKINENIYAIKYVDRSIKNNIICFTTN